MQCGLPELCFSQSHSSVKNCTASDCETHLHPFSWQFFHPIELPLRGEKYWVLHNYIRGSETFHCNETVTLTTHGSYSFMENLYPLLERWRGPLSIAVFAPGDDYREVQLH